MLAEVHESFSHEIWPSSSAELLSKMFEHAHSGVERVVLDVSSPGGQVSSAIALYRGLKSAPFELVTRNYSNVASMGNLVFLAGDRRIATPEATFLLHPIALKLAVNLDSDDLCRARARLELHGADMETILEYDRAITRLQREERDVWKIVEQETKLSAAEVSRLAKERQPIFADDALAVGIVHELAAGDDYAFVQASQARLHPVELEPEVPLLPHEAPRPTLR